MNLDDMTREELISYIMQLQSKANNLESRIVILENAERKRILKEGDKQMPLGPMEVPYGQPYYPRSTTSPDPGYLTSGVYTDGIHYN